MAQIDELIAVMTARDADALLLNSDQPAQLIFGGALAYGAVVPATLLREMLREIVPDEQIVLLHQEGSFRFQHGCSNGLMNVEVERHVLDFRVLIAPYSSPPTPNPPVENKPIHQQTTQLFNFNFVNATINAVPMT